MFPALVAAAGPWAPLRPPAALGTAAGYLDADGLQALLDRMADRYFRLEWLERARRAGEDDAGTGRPGDVLGALGAACQLLGALVRLDTPVAPAALAPFHAPAADAARVLHAHSSPAAGPPGPAHEAGPAALPIEHRHGICFG